MSETTGDPASPEAAPEDLDDARTAATAGSGVVIFIPTLNEEAHIEGVLRDLLDGDPLAAASPIVVADGGSSDDTRAVVARLSAAQPNIRLIDNPKRLQAAALNLALGPDWADRAILIRVDAHARYPRGYVSRLVAALEETGAASVVVPMDAAAATGCFQRGLAVIADTKLGAGGSPHRGGARSAWVEHGHHAAFRLAEFRDLGGYDESFVANEDAEYDRRLTESGGRIWLDAGIRVTYFPRSGPAGLWRQYRRYGEGRARTCLKHRVRPALRQLAPVGNLGLLALSALALAVTPLGWIWPATYGAVLLGASLWAAARLGSLCGLWAGPALGVMHLAWGLGFCLRVARHLAGDRA